MARPQSLTLADDRGESRGLSRIPHVGHRTGGVLITDGKLRLEPEEQVSHALLTAGLAHLLEEALVVAHADVLED